MNNKIGKFIYSLISFIIVLIILFYLTKILIVNWQNIDFKKFSFNYFYLLISFCFSTLTLIGSALIWRKILKYLEPKTTISSFKAIEITIYSLFAKYIPGKIWITVGKIYWGSKEKISVYILLLCSIIELFFSLFSAFSLGLISIFIARGNTFKFLYFIVPFMIIGFIIFSHTGLFYKFYNLFIKKFKKIEISEERYLNLYQILQITFYYLIVYVTSGLSFFFLINSFILFPMKNLLGVIGIYSLSQALGIVAIFAPSGLGVREGSIAFFLKQCLPTGEALLISFLARFWTILVEIVFFIIVFIYSKIMKVLYYNK